MTPPDLTALAREWFDDEIGLPSIGAEDRLTKLLQAVATLSRTAGRAQGLEAAAKMADAYGGNSPWHAQAIARRIRALASDPAPGEQMAEEPPDMWRFEAADLLRRAYLTLETGRLSQDIESFLLYPATADRRQLLRQLRQKWKGKPSPLVGRSTMTPAPAHPTEPGEVERLGALHDWAIADHDRVVAELSASKTEIERLRAIETAAREMLRYEGNASEFIIARSRLRNTLSTPQPKGETECRRYPPEPGRCSIQADGTCAVCDW